MPPSVRESWEAASDMAARRSKGKARCTWICGPSNKGGRGFLPKSDRRENDDRGGERERPKHNRLTKENSFGQD